MKTEIQSDLIVVGGGLAGCMAAVAAKRTAPDIEVWLVEQYGFLGGMATAGFVYPFSGYATRLPDGRIKRLTGGLFQELVSHLSALGYTEKRARVQDCYARFDPMLLRCVLDAFLQDAGVHLLFHGLVNAVQVNLGPAGDKIVEAVTVQTKAGSISFHPRWVIDATGDADVAFHAGVECNLGRDEDDRVQPATLMFRVGNVGTIAATRGGIANLIRKEKQAGNPLTPRDDILMFIGPNAHEWHFNQTRVAGFDFTDPFEMTQAEIEGRAQAERFIRFLREKVRGYRKSTVASIGTQLGVRESRRIVGEYQLTEDDLINCVQFPDRIALGNYPVDIHDPSGSSHTTIRSIPQGKYYSIPYRSLVPRSFGNLLVTG